MRPVRLDIDGFASFREPTTVDFTDVDYFALVGPTGSGKSTIIDAITFALYGTAHRWERANAVAYALAPTTNRCTVSLIFDVGGQRYQAAREVRRVGTNTIQQKNARLERFADPTAAPAPGEETPSEVLASEVRDMTPAVSELLGLDFDDFCQCVVLPQGEFARFLKAKSSDRQDILLKLLGAGHYEEIAKRAGRRAADAQKEAEVYAEQLGTLAHASVEALAAAEADATRLDDISSKIADQVSLTTSARERQREHQDAQAAAEKKLTALADLSAPAGVEERHERLTAARAAASTADDSATNAADAMRRAVEAAASGPQRVTIEGFERLYGEADNVGSLLVAARKDEQAQTTAAEDAAEDAREASEALATARTATTDAQRATAAAKQELDTLDARAARLRSVTVPTNLDTVLERAQRAGDARAEAERLVVSARENLTRLDEASRELPDPRRLTALTTQIDQLRVESQEHSDVEAALATARELAEHVQGEVASLEALHARAQDELDRARLAAGAAALRPALEVGHACPVCTQTVQEVPPTEDAPDLHAAQDKVSEAQTRLQEARRGAQESQEQAASLFARAEQTAAHASRTAHAVAQELAGAATRVGVPVGAWADESWAPTPVEVEQNVALMLAAAEQTMTETTRRLTDRDQARTTVVQAEATLAVAQSDRDAVAGELDEVRLTLARTHAGLVDAGAPTVDTTTVEGTAAGWRALASWAHVELDTVDSARLPAARSAHEEAAHQLADSETFLAQTETRATQLTALSREAAGAAAAAQTRAAGLAARQGEIDSQLATAPARTDLPGLLEHARELEEARAIASTLVEQTRLVAQQAADEVRGAVAAVAQDRDALGRARDVAGAWAPPAFEAQRLENDLPGCWNELVAWAAGQVEQTRNDRDVALHAGTETAELAAGHLTALVETLTEHGLDASTVADDPRAAERIVAVAHSEASSQAKALRDARERAGALAEKEHAARETATVAGELRSLLRADKFGNWLATAALDTLVAGASDSLMQLSDGQFTLTHIKGDFHVIDHFDADSERSVKTLSGGETFQASLALALALSEQLATLAAGGNAKLDSIFLDEGFGTLDPESLETVAATLETLAQGERMVGVVTHVAALAERTPTRFAVHHDGRTSSVERETT
ncbi:exonuclease SbcC [Nocardioides exalbidus]|uniref:Nuclease SbcCD subunit C n=1 Tax=Nocardioides exalbidus TaxID=402596 RepID=A0A1H4WS66_9ACTN|nr:SMC family ATPase [Nocardioides exalbidus]SEC95461.1 exonuclease SbcC [Nocardioides exalbidus]